jgi:hypothetical protein
MSENPNPVNNGGPETEDLGAELHNLGKNLVEFLRAVKDSPEGQRLKTELEGTLHDVGDAFSNAADDFKASEKGQQFKKDFENLRERVSNGALESKAREDLLRALKQINDELTRAIDRWKANKPQDQ